MANVDKLRKLADHLLNGKMGHHKFNIMFFNAGSIDKRYKDNPRLARCRIESCAMGECPFVFDDWGFDKESMPYAQGLGYDGESPDYFKAVDTHFAFFDLKEEDYWYLFKAGESDPMTPYGGNGINRSATKEQVGNRIIEFCNQIENKKI